MSTMDQLRVIHGLRRTLGCTDDEYRGMLLDGFNVESSKLLTDDQARNFILKLRDRLGYAPSGAHGPRKFEHLAGRPGQATPAQLRMLEAMWKDVSKVRSVKDREEAMVALLKNRFGISGGLAWLERKDVQKVVKLLRVMKADQDKQRAAEGGVG